MIGHSKEHLQAKKRRLTFCRARTMSEELQGRTREPSRLQRDGLQARTSICAATHEKLPSERSFEMKRVQAHRRCSANDDRSRSLASPHEPKRLPIEGCGPAHKVGLGWAARWVQIRAVCRKVDAGTTSLSVGNDTMLPCATATVFNFTAGVRAGLPSRGPEMVII